MESGSGAQEPASWDEIYKIDLIPTEIFFKFRKQVQGIRVGLNFEVLLSTFCSFQLNIFVLVLTYG
ncbi:unnamed protein product [Rhodiola kirilowii]